MPRNGITHHLRRLFKNHAVTKTPLVTTVRSFATSPSTPAPRSPFASASKPKPTPRTSSKADTKPTRGGSEPLSSPKQQQQQQHSDLASFLTDAKRRGLDEKSTFFTGTRYEYLVAARLARYGFSLTRVGKTSDYGIDLLGDWTIPSPSPSASAYSSVVIRVLIQCKGGDQRIGPHLIRELEGSFAGAPPGWRGGGVLGLLVGERGATRGVREALGRADVAMGYVCCEGAATGGGGRVRQMLWNQRADELGLGGVSVGVRRGGEGGDEVVLVKNGEPVPFV